MKLIDKTTIKFILVGIVNTLVGTGVMFLMYNLLHASYWISSASNYIIGSIVSYVLNKYFTFQNNEKSFAMIIKFVINISICYLAAYGVAKPLVRMVLSGASKKHTGKSGNACWYGIVCCIELFWSAVYRI